jgi:hypothetical protein
VSTSRRPSIDVNRRPVDYVWTVDTPLGTIDNDIDMNDVQDDECVE